MESTWLSLIEIIFVYGLLLAFLGWQLVDVNRAAKRSKAKQEAAKAAAETEVTAKVPITGGTGVHDGG